MSGTLPLVSSSGDGPGTQALYPVTRRVEFLTDVLIHLSGTEERRKKRPPLTRFIFPYTKINHADMVTMRNFHASQKGTFDTTWSFTPGEGRRRYPDQLFLHAAARQVQNPGQTAGTIGGTFPALGNGAPCEFPYSQINRFAVLLNENADCGMRYSWAWYGGGLNGFPAAALHGCVLSYPAVTDADLATLETFFRNQWGRFARFTFVNPDSSSTTYAKCRFDDDVMEIVHNAPNQNAVNLRILETN
jgi:hypothetical protein